MTPLIEKYISLENIKHIVKEKEWDEVIFQEFIRFLDYNLEQDDRLGFDEEDHENSSLDYATEYIDEVVKERNKGFSITWAKEYAIIKILEVNRNPPAMAYWAVKKVDAAQALKDIQLYGKLTNRDELFVKHFVHLLTVDVPNVSPSVEEQSIVYSKIFMEQITKGKSEAFAFKYASTKAEGAFTEIGCYTVAAEYEKATTSGYPLEYAEAIADEMSEYIANHFNNYEEALTDELVEMKRDKLEKKYEHFK